MDLWYDDLWSYKNRRVSCSEAKRVLGPTEMFLSPEKPQEALATKVSEKVEDGMRKHEPAMAPLLRNLMIPLRAHPTS